MRRSFVIFFASLALLGAALLVRVQQAPVQRSDAWLVDFNYPESGDNAATFSRAASSAFVPNVPTGRATLRLEVRSPSPLPQRVLALGLNQVDVARITVSDQERVLQVLLPTAAETTTKGVTINLTTPGARVKGDDRELGVLVSEALVAPLSESSRLFVLAGVVLPVALVLLGASVALLVWHTRRYWNRERALLVGLALVCVVYAVVMSYYSIAKHALFLSNTYDLGQYNQVLWLISRGQYPYSTAQGVHILGNHAAFVLYPLALLYVIVPDVRALLIVQSVVVALGAVPLFLIGRARGSAAIGLLVAVAYLLHPATQNMTLFDFHPDTLAATALLFALWSVQQRRWVLLSVACALVLASKENFGLTVAALGVWLALQQRAWLRGGLLALVSLGWFGFTTQVILPMYNGRSQSLHLLERYGQYGNSVSTIVATLLAHPGELLAPMVQPESLHYMWMLVAPFALLCLGSPQVLLLALPALVLNLLSSSIAQRQIVFHYSALIVAIAAVATLHTLLAVRARTVRRVFVVAAALWLAGGVVYGLATTELRVPQVQAVIDNPSTRLLYYNYMLSLVPPGASVVAQTTLQPHLATRTQTFMFPNPFQQVAFVNPQQMPYTASVEYVLFDTRLDTHLIDGLFKPSEAQLDLLRALQQRQLYAPIARLDGIVLLHRTSASLAANCFGQGWNTPACTP